MACSWRLQPNIHELSGLIALLEQSFQQCLGKNFVDNAAPLGEDTLDRFHRHVTKNYSKRPDPQATVVLQRPFKWPDVALFRGEITQRLPQLATRFGRLNSHEVDDLRRKANSSHLQSSRDERG